jgi:hypothetical protein
VDDDSDNKKVGQATGQNDSLCDTALFVRDLKDAVLRR